MILLGKRIKELRNNSKLTQSELAQQVGVTKSTIAAYENDSRQPSYEVLIKMANTFKVSTDSILLNHPGCVLEVHDLTLEQMHTLQMTINAFRQTNLTNEFFKNNTPDLQKQFNEYCLKK